MDLNKAEFFHFDEELIKGNVDREKLGYWYKKRQFQLTLQSHFHSERCAIENMIGVFAYVLHGKEKAVSHFENLLEKYGNSRENTLANLMFLHSDDSTQLQERTAELQSIQRNDSLQKELELARGMCERGYFCGFYITDDEHNFKLVEVAVELLKNGIKKGIGAGMQQDELFEWKYYLFETTKNLFVHRASMQDITEDFGCTMTTFLDIYFNPAEGHHFYKARALMEITLLFTYQRYQIRRLPNFVTFCQREDAVKKIWDNTIVACEAAMAICPDYYRLPHKASKIYLKNKNYEKAEQYMEKSLELNRDFNITAMDHRIKFYMALASKATQEKDANTSYKLYQKAYKCGKEVKERTGWETMVTLVEMNEVCFHLAVDKTKQPWGVYEGKEDYLEEAIDYGKRAVQRCSHKKNPRAFSGLGECYAIKTSYTKAAEYAGQAVDADKPGYTENVLKCLTYLSEKYHQIQEHAVIGDITVALERGWTKHPVEAMHALFVKYANIYPALKGRLIQKVLVELSTRNTEVAATVLKEFSWSVARSPCRAWWLKNVCKQYI